MRDINEFYEQILKIQWFSNVGERNQRDTTVKRITDWSEWNGPETELNGEFAEWLSFRKEQIYVKNFEKRQQLKDVFDRTEEFVRKQILKGYWLYDPEEDAWHGPTTCVWAASFTFALIGLYVFLECPLPDRLIEEEYWYASGHWPCDYAEEPTYDLTKGELEIVLFKLVVL